MVRSDMSEFMEKHSFEASSGAFQGTWLRKKGGQLTEGGVRRDPLLR